MINGVLAIDKPSGWSSHDVVQQVRRLSGIRRVGHAGTLDPLATGLLILCLGKATRLLEYVTELPKRYEATIRLGQSTNTYDAEGTVTEEKTLDFTRPQFDAALNRFRGPIQQLPPMFSAIKQNGQPLYKLARQGIEVERKTRQVTIYELTVQEYALPLVRLRVSCSAGTYIRSLAHDLGQQLGCGGHLIALRRTAIGDFGAEMVPLAKLTTDNWQRHLRPPDTVVSHLPSLTLPQSDILDLQQGKRVERQTGHPTAPLARIYHPSGHFIGLAALYGDQWQPKKILWPMAT